MQVTSRLYVSFGAAKKKSNRRCLLIADNFFCHSVLRKRLASAFVDDKHAR